MEHYYIALLVFLGLLAVFDLFVGVSNDAVNFLNSALGCRIASFKTTMFVASIGVMLGATFSSPVPVSSTRKCSPSTKSW